MWRLRSWAPEFAVEESAAGGVAGERFAFWEYLSFGQDVSPTPVLREIEARNFRVRGHEQTLFCSRSMHLGSYGANSARTVGGQTKSWALMRRSGLGWHEPDLGSLSGPTSRMAENNWPIVKTGSGRKSSKGVILFLV